MAKSKKKTVSRSRVAALLVILVLLAAVSLEVARVYGSRLLLESDSSLRTRIEMREGKLVQYIVPMEEEAVPVFDFSLSGARATVLEPRRSSCCGTMSSSELPYKAKEPRRVPGLS